MTPSLAGRLLEQSSPQSLSWIEFLRERVDLSWRPGEFDSERLLFIPDTSSADNTLSVCRRDACGVHLPSRDLCPSCRQEHRATGPHQSVADWLTQAGPRVRVTYQRHCNVIGCQRSHGAKGLCSAHAMAYRRWRASTKPGGSVDEWVADRSPAPLPPVGGCAVGCGGDALHGGLCKSHGNNYRVWRSTQPGGASSTVERWLNTQVEPHLDPARTTYGERTATGFGLLPEPLRWELLYAVQQRERHGKLLHPSFLRSAYLTHRKAATTTFVGLANLGFEGVVRARARLAVYGQWQQLIDQAYREWSGVDERDPRVIYLIDLTLRPGHRKPGPDSKVDMRTVTQDWIVDAVKAWAEEAPRGYEQVTAMGRTWVLAATVLDLRGTPMTALGVQDMDAVIAAFRDRWSSEKMQQRQIAFLKELLAFARNGVQFDDTWGRIPSRFAVNDARHRPNGTRKPSDTDDEPFRFVPQPIIEHLMNSLHLLVKTDQYTQQPDPYLTAQAQAMLYIQERCGRRTGETIKLADDCISYDNEGAPYLEWVRGKPPYTKGKRLPIHQETHDVIRQWQDIKRDHGITSKWLFPKIGTNSRVDQHWKPGYLNEQLKRFIRTVKEQVPFTGPVEGVEGNLIYFDLDTIDPYSFRHAFAQRYADATDAEGRPTTRPDVLQDLMGHANFNTTMAYYEVSAKRRKRTIEAVPPRRLNLHGEAVPVDRERDGFTKVAVTLGHCTEPQNVAQHGHGCMVDHACESCPFYLVDPLEREAMDAKRYALKVRLERARAINAQQHLLDHYEARIKDCTTIIDGIDAYIDGLPDHERDTIRDALHTMSEIRRLATAPRLIDLRTLFQQGAKA